MVLVVAALFAANVALGMRTHARYDGTVSGLRLRAPVAILRDDRGVPHILARNEHDLFFAQGYAEGSDRLFQMDLLRRFVKGQLAEVFGKPALASDERERAVPVRAIVDAQWRKLDASSKKRWAPSAMASMPQSIASRCRSSSESSLIDPSRGRPKIRSRSRWQPCSI